MDTGQSQRDRYAHLKARRTNNHTLSDLNTSRNAQDDNPYKVKTLFTLA